MSKIFEGTGFRKAIPRGVLKGSFAAYSEVEHLTNLARLSGSFLKTSNIFPIKTRRREQLEKLEKFGTTVFLDLKRGKD